MTTSTPDHNTDNVVDLFSGKPYSSRYNRRIIRLAPELDGLEMIYSNEAHPNKLFSIKVLCWALRADGEVVGLVPWLDDIMPCTEIQDPLNGHWEGYYDPGIDEVFFEAPIHKVLELETAAEYYEFECDSDKDVVQELPDTIGTHAVLSEDGFKSITLKEVVSWQLLSDGVVRGMLIDDDKVISTPVLPGDECLYSAKDEETFRYFFQHHIANKIKAKDPDALAAISMLVES
ncbi:hypothetical protein Q8A57_02615 [Porticoccus litoralis]|jgi:hypothetical protein|uniref:Uncharacterized protein n=1 Tax=Porticoccus litoralis TaxID=434086 RepID=A0AAW8B239_9GAMM|nr:hypothetical protein [Porticoccus litoralis]MDP1519851.1 hypothetical protein [Porticoccus litoralis]